MPRLKQKMYREVAAAGEQLAAAWPRLLLDAKLRTATPATIRALLLVAYGAPVREDSVKAKVGIALGLIGEFFARAKNAADEGQHWDEAWELGCLLTEELAKFVDERFGGIEEDVADLLTPRARRAFLQERARVHRTIPHDVLRTRHEAKAVKTFEKTKDGKRLLAVLMLRSGAIGEQMSAKPDESEIARTRDNIKSRLRDE